MEEKRQCKNCKYFRLFTKVLLTKAEDYDGFCSKRQKYKMKANVCNGFTKKD